MDTNKQSKPSEDEVIEILLLERKYQKNQALNNERPDMVPKLSVGETLLAMQKNINQAIDDWYKNPSPHIEAMDKIRKIGALAIQAGVNHGMPKRNFFNNNVNSNNK